jgi:methyltransferase
VDVSVAAFLALLAAVAAGRGVELVVSSRHQRELVKRGARKVAEPHFLWMVVVHASVLGGAAMEVVVLGRPFHPMMGGVMGLAFLCASAVRWWVIRALGTSWNVQVMDAPGLGVVTGGPYTYVRHPNYAAVFVELIALPMIHGAWLTALAGAAGHALVLSRRLAVEEPVLMAAPGYREAMAHKPRFLPRLFG